MLMTINRALFVLLSASFYHNLEAQVAPPATTITIKRGSIAGVVLDPAGNPVSKARVRAVRLQPRRATSPALVTGATGQFQINGLEDGNYAACASVDIGQNLIGDCFWLDSPLSKSANSKLIVISSGKNVTGLTLQLHKGAAFQVKLQDAGGVLGSKNPKGGARSVQVELAGPPGTTPRSLKATRTESDGPVYEAVLPAGSPIQLRVAGYGVALSDSQGKALPNGTAVQQIQPSAATPSRVVLRVAADN